MTAPTKSTSSPSDEWLATLAMFSPLALYLLALNPWFFPNQHDDVLYYFGAVALIDGDGFSLGGIPITDWPPALSAMLAAAMKVFGASVWLAKLVVLAFVGSGIGVTYAVARLHGFPAPRAVAALTGLLPISLISGAAVLSEWPYLALSMAFLWALSRLMETRAWSWAVMVGVLLALASLTRFIGVFLGVAIVVQAWHVSRQAGLRAIVPEAASALLGAAVWLLWKVRCQLLISGGEAPSGAYDNLGYFLGRFTHIEPLTLLAKIESVLFSAGKVGDKLLGGSSWFGLALGVLVGVALIIGMVLRFRRSGFLPADAYIIVCLLLFAGDLNKPERYFMPLTPFLIGNVMVAGEAFLASREGLRVARVGRWAVALWMAWALLLDSLVLFVGNFQKTRGGLSMLTSRSEREFYGPDTLNLSDALRWADQQVTEGPILASGFHGKYVLAYVGREYLTLPDGSTDESTDGAEVLVGLTAAPPLKGWEMVREFGNYAVYRRTGISALEDSTTGSEL